MSDSSSTPPATRQPASDSRSVRERVEEILDLIRPAVQSDGGDLELVDVSDDGIVSVRLLGACIGCPSAGMTLQLGIERNLKAHVPEITAVRAVT
jgi:Fe-S cluster biogenesis protein NfuA